MHLGKLMMTKMESFRLMMEAGDFIPGHVKPWLYWLQLVLFLGPVLFLKYVPARYLFVAQIFNSITAYVVFVVEGNTVSKLFGVGHFFWLVPLWFLGLPPVWLTLLNKLGEYKLWEKDIRKSSELMWFGLPVRAT